MTCCGLGLSIDRNTRGIPLKLVSFAFVLDDSELAVQMTHSRKMATMVTTRGQHTPPIPSTLQHALNRPTQIYA